MRITPAEFFVPRWTCLWATSYQFEPQLFEQFLFRRLGDPPLNVTLLIDADELAETWATMASGEQWRLQRAGRDYLVRGVKPGSGSFHAKTYFFGNDRDGLLLVGSGNLTLRGLEQGHEVFSRFDSTDDQGLAAIRSWRDWMQELIEDLDDVEVHRRWWHLRSKTRWIMGLGGRSMFVSSAHASMLAQLLADLPASVDEVHALAPFMDQHAAALAELVTATRPRQLHLYVCHRLSVDGSALEQLLQRLDCEVKLWRFEPDHFVHAKLIGVIWGDQGRMLSGSANLSRAAMTVSRADEPWANVEAGVIVSASADTIRSTVCPPELSLQALSLDGVKALSYQQPVAVAARRYYIRFAQRLADGRIEVAVQPALSSENHAVLTYGTVRTLLAGNQTAEPLEVGDRAVLLWLEDDTGAQLSNVVALDDPRALAAWMQERKQTVDKPRELDATDLDTPIGAMLERLHRTCIFDIDETAAISNAQRSLDSTSGEEADPEFWDRLVQEELALDRRITTYQRFAGGLPIDEDEVFLLLREMLERTPTHRVPSGASEAPEEGTDDKTVGKPWTPNQRLQVRLLHVLERWSRATNDPRLRWVNPFAPVRNYAALLHAVATCWENAYLPEPKLLRVLQSLFESFITGEAVAGYLLAIDQADREVALDRLPDDARSVAAALVYVALRPGSRWQSHIFDWQTFLVPGIELGVFRADHGCDAAIERLAGIQVSLSAIEDRLRELADHVDDARWRARIQKELALDSVVVQAAAFSPPYTLALAVRGISDPLLDPRLVALVRRTFQYRRVPGLVVMGPDWRLSVADGRTAHVSLPTGNRLESTRRITTPYLATLEQQRLAFGDIFAGGQAAAS
jgi:HKD family nuclease